MEIEITLNGERIIYDHSVDSRLSGMIRLAQSRGMRFELIIRLSASEVNLMLCFPPALLDEDPSIKPRQLREHEAEILDIWRRSRFEETGLTSERLLEFLHQVKP